MAAVWFYRPESRLTRDLVVELLYGFALSLLICELKDQWLIVLVICATLVITIPDIYLCLFQTFLYEICVSMFA